MYVCFFDFNLQPKTDFKKGTVEKKKVFSLKYCFIYFQIFQLVTRKGLSRMLSCRLLALFRRHRHCFHTNQEELCLQSP